MEMLKILLLMLFIFIFSMIIGFGFGYFIGYIITLFIGPVMVGSLTLPQLLGIVSAIVVILK